MMQIKDLQITDASWTIGHLKTPEDCERAAVALIDVLSKIDRDLASDRAQTDVEWRRLATKVRTLRVQAQTEVNFLRTQLLISDESAFNAQFVSVCKQIDPVAYRVFADTVADLQQRQAA